MAEDKSTEQEVVKTEDTSQEVKTEKENMIPQSRFNEVISAKKELEDRLAKIEADRKANAEKRLTEEGKFKELNEQLAKERDAFKAQADEWKTFQDSRRKTLIEKLPEEDRDIYGELSLDKLEKVVGKISGNKISVDGSLPTDEGQSLGYPNLISAANAHRAGQLDDKEYGKIHKYFTSKLHR